MQPVFPRLQGGFRYLAAIRTSLLHEWRTFGLAIQALSLFLWRNLARSS
jgi:hypothetical protein